MSRSAPAARTRARPRGPGAASRASCVVCGEHAAPFLDGLYDDRYGFPGTFSVVRCEACGHATLAGAPSSQERLYTEYYPRRTLAPADWRPSPEVSGFSAWLNGEHRLAYARVPPAVRVLDIGCGFAETLGYHRARGCDAQGVEADANVRRVADAFGLDVHVGLFDPGRYEPASFDYVTMDQVIEHVLDPVTTLAGVARVLRPGGTAILSTPNAGGWGARLLRRRWIHWHPPYHVQFFSRRSIELAASRAGLSVESVEIVTASDWLHYQWLHLLSRHEPGLPSAFWSPGVDPGRPRKIAFALANALHRTKLNHVLTRLLDAAGVGDNFVFVLRRR